MWEWKRPEVAKLPTQWDTWQDWLLDGGPTPTSIKAASLSCHTKDTKSASIPWSLEHSSLSIKWVKDLLQASLLIQSSIDISALIDKPSSWVICPLKDHTTDFQRRSETWQKRSVVKHVCSERTCLFNRFSKIKHIYSRSTTLLLLY